MILTYLDRAVMGTTRRRENARLKNKSWPGYGRNLDSLRLEKRKPTMAINIHPCSLLRAPEETAFLM
jgi:hypothetical protein